MSWYFSVVEVSVEPYVLGSKQRVDRALYLCESHVTFKDLLTLWLGLGRRVVGKRALVLFLLPFLPLLERLLNPSSSALSILRFR